MKFKELEYKRPDFESLLEDLDDKLNQIENAKSSEEYLDLLSKFKELKEEWNIAFNLVSISIFVDSFDFKYSKKTDWNNSLLVWLNSRNKVWYYLTKNISGASL